MISKEFAYILGVVYGDGYCRSRERGGQIHLKVKDKDFALKFKEVLEKWSNRKAKFFIGEFYCTNLYSKKHADIILKFDISKILKSKKEVKYEFLKGLFDSEGGIVGQNLENRRKAKRWIHFSNNNKQIIDIVSYLFNGFGIKHSVCSRIHSGFGSKQTQYEIKIYNLKGMFFFYKNINFYIKRKNTKLKEVIKSYDYYPRELFNKAKELHKSMGFSKVAKEIGLPKGVVYGWLFKNNQKQVIDGV